MTLRPGLLRSFRHRDDGVGMVLVMGTISVVLVLITVSASVTINALRVSRTHVTYEQAIAAAESGVDYALARLQRAWDTKGADYPIPSLPNAVEPAPECSSAAVTTPYPTGSFPDRATEQAWAESNLLNVVTVDGCLQEGALGEYVVLKPTDKKIVYAMGFVPSYADWSSGSTQAKMRMIKAEYIFAPYRPTHAILTGSALLINSSTTVTSASGNPADASVHTNGGLTVENGNPTVTGAVTASDLAASSGTSTNFPENPGGAIQYSGKITIPFVSAESVYRQQVGSYNSATWYDLCPDGTVRQPSAAGPCESTSVWDTLASGSGSFRGWSFDDSGDVPLWSADSSVVGGAVYFAHHADVTTGNGNPSLAALTVLASAEDQEDCDAKEGGNISWDRYNIASPMIPNLFLMADQDLATGSNFSAGSGSPSVVAGMFVAGDQISLQTSSSGAYGSVLAGDQCDIAGSPVDLSEVKNPAVYFDPNSDAPFTSIVSTTLWQEYTG